jgi:hypothetical protein
MRAIPFVHNRSDQAPLGGRPVHYRRRSHPSLPRASSGTSSLLFFSIHMLCLQLVLGARVSNGMLCIYRFLDLFFGARGESVVVVHGVDADLRDDS